MGRNSKYWIDLGRHQSDRYIPALRISTGLLASDLCSVTRPNLIQTEINLKAATSAENNPVYEGSMRHDVMIAVDIEGSQI